MKKEEKIAYEYLCSQGYTDLQYEPNGNIPPDFVLNKEIGIEVRRLNQNISMNSNVEGLEQIRLRLKRGIEGVLKEFSMKRAVKCYFIGLQFKRPIGNLKNIKNSSRKALKTFLIKKPETPHEIRLNSNVKIVIVLAGKKNRQRFRIGLESDLDSGGWTIPVYFENIKCCIEDKTNKIQSSHKNYKKWWLILIDFLHGISNQDIGKVLSYVEKPKEWDRVIIINPSTKKREFEL